jgi:trimeric autotransporter adhesin
MSTKTLRKRIALVAVSALGFGLVSVVPASAAAITATAVTTGAVATAGSQSTLVTLTTTSAALTTADTIELSLTGPVGGQIRLANTKAGVDDVLVVGAAARNWAPAATATTIVGTANIPGKYTLTFAPTAGTVASTIFVAPAQTSALQASVLTDSVNGSIYLVGSDNPTIVVTRPAGSAGNVAMQVISSADAGLAPGTYFTAAGATGQTTLTSRDGLSSAITMATSAGTWDTAGAYSVRVFVDANGNGLFDASEANSTIALTLAGAPDSSTVSLDRSSVGTAGGTVTATVTVVDVNGNPTYGNNTLTPSFRNAAAVVTPGANTLERVTMSGSAGAAAGIVSGNLTRVGTTNTYTGTATYANHADAVGGSFRLTSSVAGTGVTAAFASFSIFDDAAATLTRVSLASASGLYVGTPGAATYSTVIPVSTANATAATANVAVRAGVTVTSLPFTVVGTANKTYAITAVLSGTSDTARIAVPTTVRTLADGTAVFTVTNSAPVASATTGSDVVEITINDSGNTLKSRYTISWTPVSAVWTLSPISATNARVLEKSTNRVTGVLRNNFGAVLANTAYTVSVTGRNVTASSGITDANGVATAYTLTDTATTSYATVGGFPTDTVTFASVGTTALPAATASVTFTYVAALAAVGSVAVTVAAGDVTIDQVLADPSAPTTVDYTATVRLASGAVAGSGVLVTFTGSEDDLFLNGINTGVTDANGQATVKVWRNKVGNQTITATANGVSGANAVAKRWLNTPNAQTDVRNIALSAPQTSVGGSAATVVATVTDRWGNPVRGATVSWLISGVGRLVAGVTSATTTDANGQAQTQVTSLPSESGVTTLTVSQTGGQTADLAGFVGAVRVAGVTAGMSRASTTVTITKDTSTSTADALLALAQALGTRDQASAAIDAAAEATDASNAATDAANAAAEAADAATAAAQDAADAVAALSTQVSEMVAALKKQITSLTNLVIKIQRKVRA